MARLYQTGFELNSNTSGMEWTTTSGGFSVTTTNARSGTYCGRSNASASTPYLHVVFRTDTAADAYLRMYLYIASAPTSQTTVMAYGDSASFYGARVKLNTDRTLTLSNNDGTLSANGSTVLATSTWYRVELYYDETNNQGTVRLDGSTEIAATTIDDVGGGGKAVFGCVTSTTADLYFDDIAINDASGSYQNSWAGEGKIIHLKPDSAGDSSSWTGYVGSGANYERVDEVTPNDSTDGVRSRTTDEVEEYNLEASGIGSSDTVNVVAVGYRVNRSSGTTSSTFNVRLKDSASGTVAESDTFTASTTTWRTNNAASSTNISYPLVSYKRPGGSSDWTQSYLDSAQIGVKTVSGSGARYVQLSTIWASVDYVPASFTTSTSSSTSTSTSSTSTSLSTSTSMSTSTSSTSTSTTLSTSTSTSTSSTSSSTSISTSTSTTSRSTSTSSTSSSTSTSISTSSTSTSLSTSSSTSSTSTSVSTSTTTSTSTSSTSSSTSTSSTSVSTSTTTVVERDTTYTATMAGIRDFKRHKMQRTRLNDKARVR